MERAKVHWPSSYESPGIQIFGKEEPVKIRDLTDELLLAFGGRVEQDQHEASSGKTRIRLYVEYNFVTPAVYVTPSMAFDRLLCWLWVPEPLRWMSCPCLRRL